MCKKLRRESFFSLLLDNRDANCNGTFSIVGEQFPQEHRWNEKSLTRKIVNIHRYYKSWVIATSLLSNPLRSMNFRSLWSPQWNVSIVERTIRKHRWQGWRKIHSQVVHDFFGGETIFIVGQQFFQQHRWRWQWKGSRKIRKNRVYKHEITRIKTLIPSFLFSLLLLYT